MAPDFQPGKDTIDVEKLRDFSRVMELAREYGLWTIFRDFFQNHADWLPVPDPISIYIPREFKGLGESADEAMALAYESLVANGCLPRFASVVDLCARIIVTPVSHLGIDEIETLDSFCLQAGIVIALGVASKTCGRAWELLAGTYAPRGKGRLIQFVPPLTGQETEDTDSVHLALWRKMLSLTGWSSWSVSSPNVQVGVLQNQAGEL